MNLNKNAYLGRKRLTESCLNIALKDLGNNKDKVKFSVTISKLVMYQKGKPYKSIFMRTIKEEHASDTWKNNNSHKEKLTSRQKGKLCKIKKDNKGTYDENQENFKKEERVVMGTYKENHENRALLNE